MGYKPTKGQFIAEIEEFHGIRLSGKDLLAEELLQRIGDLFKPTSKPKRVFSGNDGERQQYAKALHGGKGGMTERDALLFIVPNLGLCLMTEEGWKYYLPSIMRILVEGQRGSTDTKYELFEGWAEQFLSGLLAPHRSPGGAWQNAEGFTRRQRILIHDVFEFSSMRRFKSYEQGE